MKNKKYLKAVFFLTCASFISVLNDSVLKILTTSTSLLDIMFLRFFCASVILTPLLFIYKIKPKKSDIKIHTIRAALFGAGMAFFTKAITHLPIALITLINFITPLFVVLLAYIFLKEPLKGKIFPVLLGMLGIFVACFPYLYTTKSLYIIILIISTLFFAALDVFNKHLLNKNESMLMMLFGSSAGIALIYIPFFSFNMPHNFLYLIWLGIGSNLILYFLLKAWSVCDISTIQPIKYIEFPISICFGNLIFAEKLNVYMVFGIILIFCATILNSKSSSFDD